MKIIISVLLALMMACSFSSSALAGSDATWTGLGADSLWTTSGDWSASPVPGSGNTATFSGAGNGKLSPSFTAPLTLNTITFDTASAAAYHIGLTGQSLTFNNGGEVNMTSSTGSNETIDANVVLGDSAGTSIITLLNSSASKLLTITGGITAGSTGIKTLDVNTMAGGVALSGIIANGGTGTVALTKDGIGTLNLSSVNTYTGGTTVNGGTLSLTGSTNSGSSVIGTGTLTINSGATVSTSGQDNPFGDNASIMHNIVINGGTLSVGNTWTTVDNITLTSGGTISGAGNLYMDHFDGSYTDLITANGLGNVLSMGSLDLHAATTINTAAGAGLTISSPINEAAGGETLTKTGAGTLILSGNNTYTGITTISTGILQVGNGSTTGSLGTGLVTDNASLIFDRSDSITEGSAISGSGTLTQNGSGTLTLGGINTYAGATTINAGKIIFDNSLTTSALNFTGNGTAEFAAGTSVSNSITTNAANQGTVTFDDGDITHQTHTVNQDIGSATLPVNQVNVGTYSTNLNGSVYAAGFALAGNGGNVTVADGKSIVAPITEAVDGSSTVNYAGSTTISYNVGSSSSKLAYVTFGGGTSTLGANIYTDPLSQGGNAATTVNSTATLNLNGNRTISGNLNLNGTSVLNVGANTLTNSGAYTQNSGSTLALTINSSSGYGVVNATNATLNSGAKVNVTIGNNYYIPSKTIFSIINAGTGSYSLPSSNIAESGDPRVTFTSSISGNDLLLTADRSTTGFAPLGSNSNTQVAGGVLDNITNPSSDMTTILNTLEGLSNSQVTSALNTIIPIANDGVRVNSAAALNNFVGASIDRAQNVLNLASAGNCYDTGVSAGDQSPLNGLWAKEYGSYLNQGTDQGISGYYAWNTGTAVGVDHLFGDSLTVGVSGGYAYGIVTSAANYGATNINSAQSTIYAGYQNQAHPYFIDAAATTAWNWYSGQRNISIGTTGYDASSEYRGQQYGTYLDGGYNFDLSNKLQLTPLASLQWDHLALGHYTETNAGALDLHVDRQSYDMLESGLGFRVSAPEIKYAGGNLSPEAHVKWLHDFISDRLAVSSTYTGGGGAFTTNGIKPPMNGVDLGGKLSFDFRNDISIIAGFDTELKDHFFAVGATAEVRYKF